MAYILSSNPDARACCINRTGWHEGVFVFPNQTIGDKDEYVFFQSEVQSKDYQQSGSRFTHWQAEISHTVNRAGFRRNLNQETQFYVLPEVFSQEICKGWDLHTVSKLLMAEGWIEPDSQGKAYRREYLPGIGRSRCYLFTNKVWE
jgi:uncharacterized protein (DUF927 family)